jgi:hydrogenase maturation protease
MTAKQTPDRKADKPRIIILGVGNLVLKDDGVGIHLLQLLEKNGVAGDNVELIDAGMCVDIRDLITEKADKVIILDAVAGTEPPGTLYHFQLVRPGAKRGSHLSIHQTCITDSLGALEDEGKAPESIVVVGIQPGIIDWGTDLSPEIEARLPDLAAMVKAEISQTLSTAH